MSYARWGGGSEWYIYWSTTSGATIDAQRLDMMHAHAGMHNATYGEIDKAIKAGGTALDTFPDDAAALVDEHDRKHLNDCVSRWVADMKQEFPHPGRPRVIRKHQNRNSR
jgi:hypothetical protein